jgi:hypothetical protein
LSREEVTGVSQTFWLEFLEVSDVKLDRIVPTLYGLVEKEIRNFFETIVITIVLPRFS